VPASQDFWDDLLGHLKDRALLPVIGPELVTVLDGERRVALSQLLGERLAERYSCRSDRTRRSVSMTRSAPTWAATATASGCIGSSTI